MRPITITHTETKVTVSMAVPVDGTKKMTVRKEGVRLRLIQTNPDTGDDIVKIHYPNGEDTELQYNYVNGIGANADPTSNEELFNQLDEIL